MEQHTPFAQASDLPDWLTPASLSAQSAQSTQITQTPFEPSTLNSSLLKSQRRKLTKELLDATFTAMFERVLSELSRGRSLKSVVGEDMREIDYDAFWQWIKRDPQRMERYKEAKEIRAEWWAGRIVEIAEAEDSAEDVARSKLKIDTYKWLMQADSRRTYGESKQVEINQSISVISALEQARGRIGLVEEVTDVTPMIEHDGQDRDDEDN